MSIKYVKFMNKIKQLQKIFLNLMRFYIYPKFVGNEEMQLSQQQLELNWIEKNMRRKDFKS